MVIIQQKGDHTTNKSLHLEQQATSQQYNNQTFANMSKEDDKIDSAHQPMGHKRSDTLPILVGLKDFNPFLANIPTTPPFSATMAKHTGND